MGLSQIGWVGNEGRNDSNRSHQRRCSKGKPEPIIIHQPRSQLDIGRKRTQGVHRVADLVDDLKERKKRANVSGHLPNGASIEK